MPTDYKSRILSAVADAKSRGWEVLDGQTLRRLTVHDTPDYVPERWWSRRTYTRAEFLSFVMRDTRAPKAVHGVSESPWTERMDRTISFSRAMEILKGVEE